ncbi:polysaccharide biosynthesis C-terminal domain-containing protein [Flavihumibacter stibioxidans]|uniref:lipopolysaccharide biosynthesis protein n=1 Tax=Flavihumibacter stibioxidans TaxID=1834163 RepID=UPI00164F3789|nr:polysaccharide biosynthesis C-terminal domain-containing protein [Flavihumibacter stibioxidans]
MSEIKKLAGQTLWYGVPTIVARFLGYLMNMALPFLFEKPSVTADITQVYAMIPFLNVLFTYGMETAYFRFSQDKDKHHLYNTLSVSLFISSLAFTALLFFSRGTIAAAAGLEAHPEYITWMCGILLFDTLATLPFAKLRQENRPRRYAFVRISGILINLLIVLFFVGVLPAYISNHPDSPLRLFQRFDIGIGWYLVGNLLGSIATFAMLAPEWKELNWEFDSKLFREVMHYSYPLVIVGFGGMVNDVLSRLIYQHVVDLPAEQAKHELGIFANVYRLAVMMSILIQAFRMAAEPYFFNQSKQEGAQKSYARVMKFFVLACCFMFLFIGLYLDVLEWIITVKSDAWAEGMYIVPILAMGNIFLGIYYNLSIWYKLTGRNMYGAYITIAGAVLTIVLNILLIPRLHYLGAALATFACYLLMMVISYVMGQKYYPVPYARKKLISYLVLVSLVYAFHRLVLYFYSPLWFSVLTGTLLLAGFAMFVAKVEKKELSKIPLLSKFV